MVSLSSSLKEVEERILKCSLCLNIFTDPTQLPCLHRFCRECLHKVIEKEQKTSLDCPLCKESCKIPEGGAGGFRTDFLIESMLEYIQLQKFFEEEDARVCISCSKKQKAAGYCFKCTDFLCEQCYQIHITSKMFKEHQRHILNLKNIKTQSLASLMDEPRCQEHPQFIAQLCCATCDNMPVCVTCTYSDHKTHELHDVRKVAKTEREKLQVVIGELEVHKMNIYELQRKVTEASKALEENVTQKIGNLVAQHKYQSHKIERRLQENDIALEQTKTDISDATKKDCQQVQKEYEEKIAKLRAECKCIMEEKARLGDQKTEEAQTKHDDIKVNLLKRRGAVDDDLKSLQEMIDNQSGQNKEAMKAIKDHAYHTLNRYENFAATASTILTSNDDWTDAKYIPGMRSASEPLIRDMKREFPELKSLRDFTVTNLPSLFDVTVTVTEREESVVHIAGIKENGWIIFSMTSCGDDHIAITGRASDEYSFLTVVNRKGEVLRQVTIKEVQGSKYHPDLRCDSLSSNRIVTLCPSGQIGVYDVRDGSHTKKIISDLTSSWSSGRFVSCIAADTVNKRVYVGSMSKKGGDTPSRDVLVFDDKLNYRHTLSLPEMIKESWDIAVNICGLVVCDYDSKRAHAVTIDGEEAKHEHEFIKPDHDGGDWEPCRVCVDKNDFIYMLWQAEVSGHWTRILTHYSQIGQLLKTIPVVDTPTSLCTILTDAGEKLLLSTCISGKLHTYGLTT